MSEETYMQWVAREAYEMGSDGCTLVSELYHPCCLEHDLGYRIGLDPRVAYKLGWEHAPLISRAEVDKRFRQCMQQMSPAGKWSPVSWLRWAGVRIGGYFLWRH